MNKQFKIFNGSTWTAVKFPAFDSEKLGGKLPSAFSEVGHTHAFSAITGRPTTISGYGITDAYTKTQIDTWLAGKENSFTQLAINKGGTGRSTLTAGSVLVGNGTSAVLMLDRSGIDTRTIFPTNAANVTTGAAAGSILIAASDGTLTHTAGLDASKITSGVLSTAQLGTGTASASTFLRGDNTWAAPNISWSAITSKPSVFTPDTHTHGHIKNDGVILSSGQATIASGDKLVFIDSSDGDTIKRATYSFDGSTTTFLRGDGQFATPTTGAATQVNISGSSVTGDFNYLAMVKGSSGGQDIYVDSDIRFDGTTNQLKISGYPVLTSKSSWYSTVNVNNRVYSTGYMVTGDGIKIQWGTISGSGSSTAKGVTFQTGYGVKFTNTPSISVTNMRAASTTATVIGAKITASSTSGFSFIGNWAGASSTGFTPTTEEYTWIAIGR